MNARGKPIAPIAPVYLHPVTKAWWEAVVSRWRLEDHHVRLFDPRRRSLGSRPASAGAVGAGRDDDDHEGRGPSRASGRPDRERLSVSLRDSCVSWTWTSRPHQRRVDRLLCGA